VANKPGSRGEGRRAAAAVRMGYAVRLDNRSANGSRNCRARSGCKL
jgi:hypothetical protein